MKMMMAEELESGGVEGLSRIEKARVSIKDVHPNTTVT